MSNANEIFNFRNPFPQLEFICIGLVCTDTTTIQIGAKTLVHSPMKTICEYEYEIQLDTNLVHVVWKRMLTYYYLNETTHRIIQTFY